MKEDNQGKPVYESPKVLKLDETEALYGDGPDCEPSGSGANSCTNPGSNAYGGCAQVGQSAGAQCAINGNGFE